MKGRCPRCKGMLFRDEDEITCLPCGWREVETLNIPYRERRNMPHYSRISGKKEAILTATGHGMGIREASRHFHVAINTVRYLIMVN